MRSTPAESAALITVRVPSTLVRTMSSRMARPQPVIRGDMKQITDARHGARDRTGVGDIAVDDLQPRIGEIDPRAGRTNERAHVVAGLQQTSGDCRTDETAGAGDQDHAHAPFWRIHNRYALIRKHTILLGNGAMTPSRVFHADYLPPASFAAHSAWDAGTSNRRVGARAKRQAAGPDRGAGSGRSASRPCRHFFARHGHADRQAQSPRL